jgi:3',5'-cyclic AMP phosphodiesterase CpdA
MRIAECGLRNRSIVTAVILVLICHCLAFAAQDQSLSQKLAALEKLPSRFSFVVFGDNRAGDPACDAVHQRVVAVALERKPDLIVNTGDLVNTPGNIQDWAKFWEMSKTITVPYFLTVGNHDIHPMAKGSERIYKEQVDLPGNELYYSFQAGNSLFVVLDTNLDDAEKKITGEQLTWLEGVLSKGKRKHTFVFVHHPLFPEKNKGKHHENSLDRYPKERDALQALFVKNKVTMVFTGHEHLYLRKTVDNIPHIIAGGGGAPLYGKDDEGGFYHFVVVTVDGDRVGAEVVDLNGKIRDRF